MGEIIKGGFSNGNALSNILKIVLLIAGIAISIVFWPLRDLRELPALLNQVKLNQTAIEVVTESIEELESRVTVNEKDIIRLQMLTR